MTTAPLTDYERTVRVDATPNALFDALTDPSALSAWWTKADGVGATGGELRFTRTAPEPLVIHVDDAARPGSVCWTVVECMFEPDWVGTHPTFTITPVDGDASELHFRHVGLTADLECIDMCTAGWNHYLGSLRDFAETGTGNPRGSDADVARRAIDSSSR